MFSLFLKQDYWPYLTTNRKRLSKLVYWAFLPPSAEALINLSAPLGRECSSVRTPLNFSSYSSDEGEYFKRLEAQSFQSPVPRFFCVRWARFWKDEGSSNDAVLGENTKESIFQMQNVVKTLKKSHGISKSCSTWPNLFKGSHFQSRILQFSISII